MLLMYVCVCVCVLYDVDVQKNLCNVIFDYVDGSIYDIENLQKFDC